MPAIRKTPSSETKGTWSAAEHERFLEAMAQHPQGPWRLITEHVGTRSIKQVQTHAQKYQQKLLRHQRGLRKTKTKVARPEHRVDSTTVEQFTSGCIVRKSCSPRYSAVSGSPKSPSSPSAPFSGMLVMLSEAAEHNFHALHGAPLVHHPHYGYGYVLDAYCEPSRAQQYPLHSYSYQVPPSSGMAPMPYMHNHSTHQPPPEWSEPEALALGQTLEALFA